MPAIEDMRAAGELDRRIYDLREELKNVEIGLLTINDVELIAGRDNTNAPPTLLNKLEAIKKRSDIYRIEIYIKGG